MDKCKNVKIIVVSFFLINISIFYSNYNIPKEKLNDSTILTMDIKSKMYNNTPNQVNVHIGDNPSNEVNLSFTTNLQSNKSTIIIKEVAKNNSFVIESISNLTKNNKYYHKVNIKNLKANTKYEYIINYEDAFFSGGFKTAPIYGSKDKFKFAYLADTQVSNNINAKAVGATFYKLSKNIDFLFLAGDITDKSTDEQSWEYLFENKGLFPNGCRDLLGNTLISVVQGNHDNRDFSDHILVPSMIEKGVYSFDYGPATFIMLNFENIKYDETSFEKQKQFLYEKVSSAKLNKQWVFVGFHKAIYTGASHITDSDIIKIRKYWAPILANLDIDFVMQGHDHVYSRGFINNKGEKIDSSKDKYGNIIDPINSPLYIVGGHAGGLKWYPKKDYSIDDRDPLLQEYKFLDINSNDSDGYKNKEQTFIELDVSYDKVIINTYMFKYDANKDDFTRDKYLYDSITIIKNNN